MKALELSSIHSLLQIYTNTLSVQVNTFRYTFENVYLKI